MTQSSSKLLLAALVSAASAAALAAPASAGSMTIGSSVWIGYGPLFLARDLGYYKKLGLDFDIKVFDASGDSEVAMASGKIDGITQTVDGIMNSWRPDNCYKAVLGLDDSYGGDGIVVNKDITSLADLKGKDVAMDELGVSGFWMQYILAKQGMSIKDIHVVQMSADAASAAFIAGRVPAAVTWEPNLTFATTQSDGKLLENSRSTPGVIVDVVSLSCSYIEKHPEDVKALVTGWYQALDYIKANPQKAQDLMAKSIGGYLSDPKDVADAMKNVRFYDQAINAKYFGTADKPGPILDTFELGNKVAIDMGRIKDPIDPHKALDWDFVNPPQM